MLITNVLKCEFFGYVRQIHAHITRVFSMMMMMMMIMTTTTYNIFAAASKNKLRRRYNSIVLKTCE
jgi:hypothetical protein